MTRVFISYQGESVELPLGETLIGRDLHCRLRFNDQAVSRRHLRITVLGDLVRGEDLCTTNGSFLNGKRLSHHEATKLNHGDLLRIGSRELEVQIVEGDHLEEPEPRTLLEGANLGGGAITTKMPALSPTAKVSEHQQCPKCKANVNAEDDECSSCGYSWFDFRPHSSTKVGDNPLERRLHKRHDVQVPILYSSETLELETVALDLSLSGVFVSTEILDPENTYCTLTIMVDGGPPVTIKGRVRRVDEKRNIETDRPPGLGIEFTAVSEHARRWLEATIARVAA